MKTIFAGKLRSHSFLSFAGIAFGSNWGGEPVWHRVTSLEETDPDNHPIEITVDEAGKTLEISVEGEHLKAIENGTLDLCYWLLSDAITRVAVGHKSLYAEQL